MKSIKSIYKIGHGPSSSHTVAPYRAAKLFSARYPKAQQYRITLYGSLAFTGEGHGTAKAIRSALPGAEVVYDRTSTDLPHPNTMLFEALRGGAPYAACRIFSIGGGSVRIEGEPEPEDPEVYSRSDLSSILDECRARRITLTAFIREAEGDALWDYLERIWAQMQATIKSGLSASGVLPGGLGVERKAKLLYQTRLDGESADVTMNRLMASYAYAVSEENADEQIVVTAPTCGSCGVLPAVMYYMQHDRGYPVPEILSALAVAGLIGNVIRTNASISGAECGCQAEIGSACSMAAGGLAALFGLNVDQIEYAAEIAMEHHLGLTCDPVCGLVQIPCIERNAVAAMRAVSAVNLSRFLYTTRKISFDEVVATMYRTGRDMDEKYRETSHGGLAALYSSKQGSDNLDKQDDFCYSKGQRK